MDRRVFDSDREKMKQKLEKSQETLENSLYTRFECGSNKVFSIAKQVRSADEGTSVYSTNITINGGMDDNFKWVFLFFGSLKIITSYMIQQLIPTRKFILCI